MHGSRNGVEMIGKADGGPAFPRDGGNQTGMTLRDYFAGQALLGITSELANEDLGTVDFNITARSAYEIADAMIRARQERDPS